MRRPLLLVSFLSSSAAAAPGAPPEPAEYEIDSYRPSMIASGVTTGAMFAALAIDDMPRDVGMVFLVAGNLGTAFSGAAVHIAHGEGRRALASVGMRGGLALLGFGIGAAIPCTDPPRENPYAYQIFGCEMNGAMIGAIAGVSSAFVLETIFLTDKRVPKSRLGSPARTWTPIVNAAPGGGQLGLAGTF